MLGGDFPPKVNFLHVPYIYGIHNYRNHIYHKNSSSSTSNSEVRIYCMWSLRLDMRQSRDIPTILAKQVNCKQIYDFTKPIKHIMTMAVPVAGLVGP